MDVTQSESTAVDSGPDEPRAGMMRAGAAAAVGGLAGLTWAAGFRGYMSALAGKESAVTWYGTFGTILAPAAAVGALFGWAEHRRLAGDELPYRRAIAAAPMALGVLPLTKPGALATLRKTGEGSGAGAVALAAIGGGYAVAGRGPVWTRVATGVLAAAVAAGAAASVPSVGGRRLSLATPRGALTAALGAGSVLTFALAASVPFRARATGDAARGSSAE
ncbi:hypothetical protein [Agromyces sp. Soil535]|uniref:hypothetical protein n=1 Tax=Agromyces sp. Soil535 TaxID=1736390 RepID=UPI0006FAD65B|nr:hypothetical protein [Agromyces sp. Soil535]KRE31044.1 hypothetical protein ASG80_00675 [Agromyces sp. Soil535]